MQTMTDHTIKVNRALRMSDIGAYPSSASAMLAAIPSSVIDRLPAREIAALLDANWRLAGKSKAIACADAIAEGMIWDAKGQCHREISQ